MEIIKKPIYFRDLEKGDVFTFVGKDDDFKSNVFLVLDSGDFVDLNESIIIHHSEMEFIDDFEVIIHNAKLIVK